MIAESRRRTHFGHVAIAGMLISTDFVYSGRMSLLYDVSKL